MASVVEGKGVEPAVWGGNGREIIFVPYKYSRVVWPESLWDDVSVHDFFLRRWSSSIAIAIAYVVLIHTAERWMRDRKAFSLRGPLIIWNSALALFSLIATLRFNEESLFTLSSRPLLHSICYSVDPRGPAAFWALAFALSKAAELVDTAFIVLRKRPLIFLHWYHHAVVLVYSWHSAVELTAAGRWFIGMNYAVHTVMYSYYAATSAGFRPPKLISMLVTTLQTSQMIIGVLISIAVLALKLSGTKCQQSYENLALCFAIYASFAFLFMKFFRSAYLSNGKKKLE